MYREYNSRIALYKTMLLPEVYNNKENLHRTIFLKLHVIYAHLCNNNMRSNVSKASDILAYYTPGVQCNLPRKLLSVNIN